MDGLLRKCAANNVIPWDGKECEEWVRQKCMYGDADGQVEARRYEAMKNIFDTATAYPKKIGNVDMWQTLLKEVKFLCRSKRKPGAPRAHPLKKKRKAPEASDAPAFKLPRTDVTLDPSAASAALLELGSS